MQFAILAARLLLSGVFGVAGLAKLADRAGSRQALIDFGVPRALAHPLAVLLPLGELVVAVALLPVASAWFGAAGALSLLLLFVFGIAFNLARGRTPDCHCFGQISSGPAGWPTLSRNVALAAVAGMIVLFGNNHAGTSAVGWFVDLTVPQRSLAVMGLIGLGLLAAEGWILQQMLHQQGRLLLRLDAMEARLASAGLAPARAEDSDAPVVGLPVGSSAPAFRLDGLRGETLTLEALLAPGKPVLLFFTHPNCGPCQALMPEIGRWQREYVSALTIALVSEGDATDNRAKSAEHKVTQVLLQKEREVAEAYQANGTPSAVLVRSDGTIGSPVAMGADAIRVLFAQVFSSAIPLLPAPAIPQNSGNGSEGKAGHHGAPPQKGQPAPSLKLKDLKGRTINLNAFRGRETLVLFWNTGCGFCQQMLDDLKDWENNPPPGAPNLLVVSTGTAEDNMAMNLRSTVVLDPDFQVGPSFGANGTPMAVLLDKKGRIASEVVAGAQQVLTLGGAKTKEVTGTL